MLKNRNLCAMKGGICSGGRRIAVNVVNCRRKEKTIIQRLWTYNSLCYILMTQLTSDVVLDFLYSAVRNTKPLIGKLVH